MQQQTGCRDENFPHFRFEFFPTSSSLSLSHPWPTTSKQQLAQEWIAPMWGLGGVLMNEASIKRIMQQKTDENFSLFRFELCSSVVLDWPRSEKKSSHVRIVMIGRCACWWTKRRCIDQENNATGCKFLSFVQYLTQEWICEDWEDERGDGASIKRIMQQQTDYLDALELHCNG